MAWDGAPDVDLTRTEWLTLTGGLRGSFTPLIEAFGLKASHTFGPTDFITKKLWSLTTNPPTTTTAPGNTTTTTPGGGSVVQVHPGDVVYPYFGAPVDDPNVAWRGGVANEYDYTPIQLICTTSGEGYPYGPAPYYRISNGPFAGKYIYTYWISPVPGGWRSWEPIGFPAC